MERFLGTIHAKQKIRKPLRMVGLITAGAHGLELWSR
jgi:hypothetical protein